MTELFSETVTTAVDTSTGDNSAKLTYSQAITANTITVTFDGTKYVCSRIDKLGVHFYGGFSEQGPTFTEYPFYIASSGGNKVYTETAGEHTVAASVPTLQTSADFDAARGWSYDAGGTTELFSETVTTTELNGSYSARPAYSQLIDADTITVNFDGTEYTCTPIETGIYGAPEGEDSSIDFSTYPFFLMTRDGKKALLITQTAGEHTIAVVTNVAPSAKASEQFAMAVGATGLLPLRCVPDVTTYAEMAAAADAGRLLYFYPYSSGGLHLVMSFQNEASETAVTAFPEGQAGVETYGFNGDMVFSVFIY